MGDGGDGDGGDGDGLSLACAAGGGGGGEAAEEEDECGLPGLPGLCQAVFFPPAALAGVWPSPCSPMASLSGYTWAEVSATMRRGGCACVWCGVCARG